MSSELDFLDEMPLKTSAPAGAPELIKPAKKTKRKSAKAKQIDQIAQTAEAVPEAPTAAAEAAPAAATEPSQKVPNVAEEPAPAAEAPKTPEALSPEPRQGISMDRGAPYAEPEPGDLVGPGAPVPKKVKTTREVAQLWDTMMTEVSTGLRDAIWEQGVIDMPTLLTTPQRDLVHPRGSLTPQHVAELQAWLSQHELRLQSAQGGRGQQGGRSVPSGRPRGSRVETRQETQELRERRQKRIAKHKKMRRG